MPKLTKLVKLKSLKIREPLGDGGYYSATYEDVVSTEIGQTNCLIVERVEIRGEEHYLFVAWYSGEDNLEKMGYKPVTKGR